MAEHNSNRIINEKVLVMAEPTDEKVKDLPPLESTKMLPGEDNDAYIARMGTLFTKHAAIAKAEHTRVAATLPPRGTPGHDAACKAMQAEGTLLNTLIQRSQLFHGIMMRGEPFPKDCADLAEVDEPVDVVDDYAEPPKSVDTIRHYHGFPIFAWVWRYKAFDLDALAKRAALSSEAIGRG